MLKLVTFALAAFGSLATAAPSGSEPEGNISFLSRTKEEGLEMAKVNLRNRDVAAAAGELDERQIPSFGRYCADWNYQGDCYYHRANIDGKGYYIGDDWNDRISSIENYDGDKQCSYWTNYDSNNGGYCWGDGLILDGRVSYPQLGSPFNDAISCRECAWS